MRVARWAPFLLSVALYSSDGGNRIEGKWAVEYVSGLQMKTIGGADFEFKAAGNTLTGMANVGHGWPGVAPISDGRIDGDRYFVHNPGADSGPARDIRKCASLGQSVATKSNSPWTSIRMPPRGIHSVERILRDDARQANKRQRTSRGGTPTGERLVGACPVTHLSATDQPFEPPPSSNFGPRRGGGVNTDQQRQRSERRHES